MKSDLSNIMCIKLQGISNEKLFALDAEYGFPFELMCKWRDGIGSTFDHKLIKFWVDMNTKDFIAGIEYIKRREKYGKQECESFNNYANISDDEIVKIKKIKPVNTPKIKKDDLTVSKYKKLIEDGYSISIPALDSKLGINTDELLVSIKSDDIKSISVSKLEKMMLDAVDSEDYETASMLRDQINEMK